MTNAKDMDGNLWLKTQRSQFSEQLVLFWESGIWVTNVKAKDCRASPRHRNYCIGSLHFRRTFPQIQENLLLEFSRDFVIIGQKCRHSISSILKIRRWPRPRWKDQIEVSTWIFFSHYCGHWFRRYGPISTTENHKLTICASSSHFQKNGYWALSLPENDSRAPSYHKEPQW